MHIAVVVADVACESAHPSGVESDCRSERDCPSSRSHNGAYCEVAEGLTDLDNNSTRGNNKTRSIERMQPYGYIEDGILVYAGRNYSSLSQRQYYKMQ